MANLTTLSDQIQSDWQYVGELMTVGNSQYEKDPTKNYIGSVLHVRYHLLEIRKYIYEYQLIANNTFTTVPDIVLVIAKFVEEALTRCNIYISDNSRKPLIQQTSQVQLDTPEMLRAAQQIMWNFLPQPSYDVDFSNPIPITEVCRGSIYNREYADLSILATKAVRDIESLPDVLQTREARRQAEQRARDTLQRDIGEQEQIRRRLQEEATAREEMIRVQQRRAATVTVDPITSVRQESDGSIWQVPPPTIFYPVYVGNTNDKPIPEKIAGITADLNILNGTESPPDSTIKINFKTILNNKVPGLGNKIETILSRAIALISMNANQSDIDNLTDEIDAVSNGDLLDNQERISEGISGEQEIHYVFPMEALYRTVRFLKPASPGDIGTGLIHKRIAHKRIAHKRIAHKRTAHKRIITEKQNKKHNITKHRKKI